MKKLILLLLFSTTLNCVGQENQVIKEKDLDKSIWISSGLSPYVNDYIYEADKRGLNVIGTMLSEIDSVKFDDNLRFPNVGHYNTRTKNIKLAPYTLMDTLMLRTIVFHEITHALTKSSIFSDEHSCVQCNDIMSKYTPPTYGIYFKEEDWQKALDKMFLTIEKRYKKESN